MCILTGQNSFGFNNLYPGNTSNVTLLLSNFGDSSSFIISVAQDDTNTTFSFNISKNMTTLGQNETTELILTVTASKNASHGDRIQFIITASTMTASDQRNNFVSILFLVSTIPPPNQTTNVSYF